MNTQAHFGFDLQTPRCTDCQRLATAASLQLANTLRVYEDKYRLVAMHIANRRVQRLQQQCYRQTCSTGQGAERAAESHAGNQTPSIGLRHLSYLKKGCRKAMLGIWLQTTKDTHTETTPISCGHQHKLL